MTDRTLAEIEAGRIPAACLIRNDFPFVPESERQREVDRADDHPQRMLTVSAVILALFLVVALTLMYVCRAK